MKLRRCYLQSAVLARELANELFGIGLGNVRGSSFSVACKNSKTSLRNVVVELSSPKLLMLIRMPTSRIAAFCIYCLVMKSSQQFCD